jgi:hypothetical protein
MAKHLAFALALTLPVLGLAACSPAQPSSPTFVDDVRPILIAHCTRCHGGSGDMLLGDPDAVRVNGLQAPIDGFFGYYYDRGDCTMPDGGQLPRPPLCEHGAHTYATEFLSFWQMYVYPSRLMPPAPAAPLNDFEIGVLNRWIANPICGSGPFCSVDDGGSVD